MTSIQPQVRPTETYTASNFLRLHTAPEPEAGRLRLVTIEHLSYRADAGVGWRCATIVDGEAMSKEDALFIAHSYAERNNVPVIYESHSE
jgi:hypothetical protein